ncbi:DUF6884 domain-containing protein [Streptomyces sp. NPDC001068]|uniref:DUF6884 domain-containing protein n=1 Tax=Streptomyces sp. NPDC001068 TaxID=3364544 RepID=UPI0036C73D2B
MGERFATPEDVLSYWRLEEGDRFRIAETKDEAASRRHNVRRRGEQASDAELVGEALVVARIHYPDANRYRWGVFHAETAQPVLTLELEDVRPSDNGDRARELAQALDQWRDAATQEPFDWTSEGLVDRLRSPYGRGMLDQVRGTDPGSRWVGTVSADPTSWETDDGQTYRYDHDADSVSVFDPDGLLIARGDRKFDVKTKKSATIGEMRDGRHIAGQRVSDFVSNAVWQHRIAQMEPEARDDVWIYYRDHRPIVHGTDKYADDWPAMKALLRSAGFTWSGYAKAYVTAGTTRNISRAQSVDRLARALYEQGRMVEIRADEDRLRGVLAPAAPPPSAAPVAPAPQAPPLTPQDLTTEQLTAELARLDEERRSAAYGSPRHAQIDKQVALLKAEHDERQVVQLADRPDPAGMGDAEMEAEREELQPALRTRMYTHAYADDTPLGAARRERLELLRAEHGRRTAVELEARTPVNQMKDEDLKAEGVQLAKDRHAPPREARDAMDSRVSAVGKELADRRLQVWGEQPPVDGYDDIELSEALEAVRGTRLSEAEFAGSPPAKERVEKAIDARRKALQEEIKKRDEKAFTTLLETDGRIRLETSSYTSDSNTRVKIDNRWYGSFTDFYPGWRARLWRGVEITHDEVWRTDALRWLIEQYEKDPETRDTRTWGPYADVELLPAFAEQLTAHQYNGLSPSGAEEKYLIEEIADSSRSQTFDAYGNKRMMHLLDLPERTLPALEQMGRRLLALIDEELDSDDRKVRAKAKSVRPKILATLDDLVSLLGTHRLEPLTADNTNTGTSQDGDTDGERLREDGPSALGDLPAPGAGTDGGPGGVLPGPGEGRTAADRGADPGEDGRTDAGDGPPAAGGQVESSPADGPGTGAEGDRVPAAGGGEPGRGAAPLTFRPTSQDDLAPAGERAKAAANLEAVRVLKRVREEAPRPATAAEQQILARWSGWGSVPEIFAARPREDDPAFGPGGERDGGYAAAAARWEALADVRDPLRTLLNDDEWSAAAASTLSAHYTPPEITAALWEALTDLGFDGGDVLEPGSGAGVTFGTAPDTARLTGVEIDPTSAAISRLLAPGVSVLNESFADTVAPDGAFDATVGNVPFARVALFDPKHNKGRYRIHNHFLVKSVALTRPGGIVALITSRHTLDALLAAARQDLLGDADLLGAVRLPNKAFARSAGTDVVTDILILRRRIEGEGTFDPGTEGYQDSDWVRSVQHEIGEHTLPVNSYFLAHPEHVLGTLTTRMGARGPEVAVDGDPDVSIALRTALRQITDRAVLARRSYTPHPEGPHRPHLRLKPAADLQDFTGRLSADADGKLWQASSDGEQTAVDLPADQHAQLAALIELKDLVRGLNELDRSGSDRALADDHRRLTKQTYERYVAAHGPLSRPRQQQHVTTTTDAGDVTGLTGWGYFLNDPQAYEVLALEMWEAGTETVHVSEVLDHAPAARSSLLGQHTDDPQLALDTVVAERGRVDLPHIAWMLQVDEDEARRRLGRSVFNDPLTPELHYSADYLSGDVRTKLQIARQAARRDPSFQVNVAELERVLPREMLPGQFAVSLGAAWIPDDLVQEFFRSYLGDAHLTIQHSGNGNWHILKGRGLSEEDEVKHTAGGLAPLALLNRVLNGGAMTGRPSDDEEAARAVRVKAEEWRDAFQTWVLDDSVRAARTADVYNRQMNNRVVRDFTGSRPSLAGLDPDFDPYDHQLAAAARMAHERCLVLSHVVGAGKTGALAIGMMAMRNSGQIDKPMVAVPNYLVEQWEGEVRRLYPTARILTLTSADLADGKRDRMLQYVRANSFDMIIVSHSLFDSLPLSPDFYEFYNNTELQKLDAQILHERRREGKSISLKQLQERRQQYEEELKAKAAAYRVPGQVYIDDLGVDFFAIDEAHEYKNLAVRSKIPGARVSGSAKAQHLHAVLEWARMNKPKGPMGCLATGTPLSNAIGELHSLLLQAYPELLRALGIEEFDAFASMYGRLVERLEMTVDGKGFKSVERFASFHSVNSLLRQLWLPAVDYKDEEDLGLVLPSLAGGQPELMLVPPTADQEQRMHELGERYEAFHKGGVDKSIDNPLSINNDARVIALDPRLIDAEAEPGNKLRVLADRVAAEYHETKNNRYTYSTEDLRPHPVAGALQMVFLNHGTPGANNRGHFNAYQEFKDLLIARDVPADKIDFIHDASRADQRRKLVARANHGGCNVLIGSTQRMGKGLNAQNRCTALYHADPDYRPADMKQKDGRARRKGNQNKNVKIVWVATEKTFDSRMYGILATKAKGFDQLYKARLDAGTDEIQEVDEALVPYEEAMAIISGNVYLIAQEELRKQVRTLTLDQNNRATQRAIVHQRVERLNKEISSLARDINRRGAVLPSLRPVLGDDFRITLSGLEYTKHKDAAAPLTDALAGVLRDLPERRAFNPETTLGQLGGRDLVAVAFRDDRGEPFLRVHLDGLPGSLSRFDSAELAILKGETLLRRLTKTITDAPERQIEDQGNRRAKQESRHKLLVQGEQLRGQVPGLARVRERLSLIDALVVAQIAVNKAGEPAKDESATAAEQRAKALARRDELQQQLDTFNATPPPEESSEAGEALLDLDDLRPRDPASLSADARESEAAILRAHITVHGDPDGRVTDRLAELDVPEVAGALMESMDGFVTAAPREAAGPSLERADEAASTPAAPDPAAADVTTASSARSDETNPAEEQPTPVPEGQTEATDTGVVTPPAAPRPPGVPAAPADSFSASDEELYNQVPGLVAGPGVVEPGMHVEFLPGFRPGARTRYPHGGEIVSVGTTNVRWRPYKWHQDVRTPLEHMRIDAGTHLNMREDVRRFKAARDAGQPVPQTPDWCFWSLAEHLAYAGRTAEQRPGPLVIIPCGSSKLDHAAPAGELYVGSYHRSCRAAADALTADGGTVLILSALYGLVPLEQEIEPYDLRMGQLGSVAVEKLREQAQELGVDGAQEVVILAGETYTDAALLVWPEASTPLAGLGGMGYHLQYLARLAADPSATVTPQPPEERPQEETTESPGTGSPLQELIDGFGDRVVIGHIGGPQTGATPPKEPAQPRTEKPALTDETTSEVSGGPAPESTEHPTGGVDDQNPGSGGDGMGTADLFETFGLPQPARVPAPSPEVPSETPPEEEASSAPVEQEEVLFQVPTGEGASGADGQPGPTVGVEDLNAAAVLRHYEPLLAVVGLSGADAAAYLSGEAAADPGSDTPFDRLMDDIGRRADRAGGISQQGRAVTMRDVSEDRHTLHRHLTDLAIGAADVRQGRKEPFGIDLASILADPDSRLSLPDTPEWRLAAAVPTGQVVVAHHPETGYAVYNTLRRRKAGEVLRAQRFRWDPDTVPEGVWRPRTGQSEDEQREAVRALLDALAEAGVTHATHGQMPGPAEPSQEASPTPSPAETGEEAASVASGQPTEAEAQLEEAAARPGSSASRGAGRERLVSADGRLTFTLPVVPEDAGFHQAAVEGYQRRRAEFAAVVEAKDVQAAQTPEERTEQLTEWRRSFSGVNGLEPFRPYAAPRLIKGTQSRGFAPQSFTVGSSLTWRDEQSGLQVTGQVMSPGAAHDTWYVSTDRSGHTGEYHVLTRSGKKKSGYHYSINGAAVDVQPAEGLGEQMPLEDLAGVDSIPARPITSYADYIPGGIWAPVRESIPVTVGKARADTELGEVAIPVTADGIPFSVIVNRNDDTGTETFQPCVVVDGEVRRALRPMETRGEAVDACVRLARDARENFDKPLRGRGRDHELTLAADGVCGACSLQEDNNATNSLYRVDNGDPQCIDHVESSYGVEKADLHALAEAVQLWTLRVAPQQPAENDTVPESPTEETAEQMTAAAPDEPHEVDREALQGGNRITAVVSGLSIEWDGEAWGLPRPETATVTGTVFPGYRDYRQNATLLDAVIVDQTGKEVAAPDRLYLRNLPAKVQLLPAEHRDDLRPEPRTVAQVRLGDLIAEGGARGESVTELRYGSNRRGSVTGFSTRDVATGAANGFALDFTDEVQIVPRERRRPQDVAAVFGHHGSDHRVAVETRQTYELHTAVTEVASRVWPNGDTGPQSEIQALSAAIGAIDAAAKGVDAYRANAAAMEAADAAAAALFAATDDDMLIHYVGEPLHRLRQHLDVQAQRLHADVAHLIQRAAAAPAANPSAADVSTPHTPDEQGAQDQPTQHTREGEDVASHGTGETEQLGLFGDPEQDPSVGPTEPETAPDSGDLGAQLQAALIEGETIAPASFTDGREPAAGWILTTAAGHTFRLRPVTHSLAGADQWDAGHDADASYWWGANVEDRPLATVLARIREDSATRSRFASLWARYGHLTAQAPEFETTTDRLQLEEGVYLVHRFGRIGLIASCRWGWEHLTDPDGAEGRTGEEWSRKGPDKRQYVSEWKIWNSAQDDIPNTRLRVLAQLTDDMADTPDAYCDASAPYVGKCSAKRSGSRYTVSVVDDQGSELGCYTVCARCLSHRLLRDEDQQIGTRDVLSLAEDLAKGDPKVSDLHWNQWPDRIAEVTGQMLSAALEAGETAPWPTQALTAQIIAEACEAGDDRAMREARAEARVAGGDAKAQKRAAKEALAARQDRPGLVARRGVTDKEEADEADRTAVAILELAGSGWEGSGAAPESAEQATEAVAVDISALTVSPRVHNGEPSSYEFTVTGPGLTVGTYNISHDCQGPGARGIMWRAYWHGVEPSGQWDVIGIGIGKGESAALAAVAEHAANAGGDVTAGFTVARRMHYDSGEWLLPDVGESEAIEYNPDGSWTITAKTGAPYTVRYEWEGRTASGDLAPLVIEDQAGSLVASCKAVDGYMSAWEPMLERLRLHATAVAEEVPHATVVTLGGPTQEWVEAWCVCTWTERADVTGYAYVDRSPAGEALALAHHQARHLEAATADAAPQPVAAVVTPTPDDAAQTEIAQAPAVAELPELDAVLLDVDLPQLDAAEPYGTDEEAKTDIDRLGKAFARWDALPTVQRYYDADRQQRPDGSDEPTNPVAQLAAAYQDTAQFLSDNPAGTPEDMVRQVHTVAVWSGALEAVAAEDLRGPLREVREAAALLASRSQATVEAFEAELAALAANSGEQAAVDLESAAAEPGPDEQVSADVDSEPKPEESSTEPGLGEPADDTDAAESGGETPITTDSDSDDATEDDPRTEPEEASAPSSTTAPGPAEVHTPDPEGAQEPAAPPIEPTPADAETDSDANDEQAPGPQEVPQPLADDVAVPENVLPDAHQPAAATDELPVGQDDEGEEPDGTDTPNSAPYGAPEMEDTAMTTPPVSEPEAAEADAVTVEDPPEPQRWTDSRPFPLDPDFELRLSGFDGQEADSGEVWFRGGPVADLQQNDDRWWIGRNRDYALPHDATAPLATVFDAAEQIAVQYSAVIGHPYGEPPVAAVGDSPNALADVLRSELSEAAARHGRSLVSFAELVADGYSTSNPHAVEMLTRLNTMAQATSNAYTAPQMAHALSDVWQAAEGWRESLPYDFDNTERQLLGYPLAQLLVDVRRLEERLEITGNQARAERAAAERAAAEAAPAVSPPAQDAPQQPVEPTPAADTGRPTENPTTEALTSQDMPEVTWHDVTESPDAEASAPEGADVEVDAPADVLLNPETAALQTSAGTSEAPTEDKDAVAEVGDAATTPQAPAEEAAEEAAPDEDDGPTPDHAVNAIRQALEDALQQADDQAAPSVQPGDLPLWTGSETAHADTAAVEAPREPIDVRAAFEPVLEAWQEHVPPERGTVKDLLADLNADLDAMQRSLAEAASTVPPAAPPAIEGPADTTIGEPEEATVTASLPQQAAAVNVALQQADTHAAALQDFPEWQKIQTLRGAFGHLVSVIKERAGEQFDRLMEDNRVGEFFRKVSIKACEKVAGWAQAGADWLRRRGEGADAPGVEALRNVADTATAYRTPGGRRNGPPPPAAREPASATVDIPAMNQLGEALSRPMPGARDGRGTRVSAAAARGKSTTLAAAMGLGSGKKKPGGPTEQAGHLRRSGADPQQDAARPTQR